MSRLQKIREEILEKVREYHFESISQNKSFEAGDRIPYAGRFFDEQERLALTEASLDFWLTKGRFTETFEKNLAHFVGSKYALSVNSGSSANLVAFSTLTSSLLQERQIQPGDEVITVAAGFPTTVAPIIQNQCIPVFVDIQLPTYNIEISQLETALSSKTRAVMIAHTLGNPFDIETILSFCKKNNLWLIEDNCDALGSRYKIGQTWKMTGTFGDLATSSFYPPHHITTGEGGAVYTSRARLKQIAQSFRDWGRDCWCESGHDNTCSKRFGWQLGDLPHGYDHKYTYSHFGYNLNMTDLQAAIGVEQLKKAHLFAEKRRNHWSYLRSEFADLQDFSILPEPTPNSDPSWFGFILTVKKSAPFSRNDIVTHLEANNIQTRMLFSGNMIKHPAFDNMRKMKEGYRQIGQLETTNLVMNNSFWLGVYPGLSEGMLEYMVQTLRHFTHNQARQRSVQAS